MKLIIHLLLLSSLLILIRADVYDEIRKAILETIEKTNGTTSTGVKFHVDGELGKGTYAIVWKGDYCGLNIACKLTMLKDTYATEMEAYTTLNAVYNPAVEKHGIPNVYVHGDGIISPYWVIGMTLLEENLEERWEWQNKNISELSILLIFKRGVEILEYLNKKDVLHNDIKPLNIFFRGSDVFFGDFNMACRYGRDLAGNRGFTSWFASSGLYLEKERTPMDDLESLVFSMWSVAGIECDKVNSTSTELKPEGETLAECKQNGTAKSKMNEKCNCFKSKYVREAFKRIAADEMLEEKHAPNYKQMKTILNEAIKNMDKGKSIFKKNIKGTPQFEWLTGQSSRRVLHPEKYC